MNFVLAFFFQLGTEVGHIRTLLLKAGNSKDFDSTMADEITQSDAQLCLSAYNVLRNGMMSYSLSFKTMTVEFLCYH